MFAQVVHAYIASLVFPCVKTTAKDGGSILPTFEWALVGFGDRSEEETKAAIRDIAHILNQDMRDAPL